MQLSKNTVDVLKNFSTINTALWFKSGNVLRTISPFKTVLAEAVIDEAIPSDFGVYDLHQLLSILSLYPDTPEVFVAGNDLVIQGNAGRSKITYRCCDATMIKTPPDKEIVLPSEDLSFLLTEADLEWVLKSASVLGNPNIAVMSDGNKLVLKTLDSSNDSAHTDTLDLGPHTGDPVRLVFKTENWKFLPGTYAVTASSKSGSVGVARFQNQARKIVYFVAIEGQTK
jgi:hypothetical protein